MIDKGLFIKMVVSAWETQNRRISKLLETLSDTQLMDVTAPGRNSGIYLIGHLAAVSDGMFPILGWGERLRPDLEVVFVKNPDKRAGTGPALSEVKEFWTNVNLRLSEQIEQMREDEWFEKHTLVSDADFAKDYCIATN